MSLEVVWFKRDLRTADHAPLAAAAARARETGGAVLPLLVVEPDYWALPDTSGRQFDALAEVRDDLARELDALGAPLVVRVGDVVSVLDGLAEGPGIAGLWAHEETGNAWTYARDEAVRAWARRRGVPFTELRQNGVIRGLKGRDGWARAWDRFMAEPMAPTPEALPPHGLDPGAAPDARAVGLAPDPCPGRQNGGRTAGLAALHGFLEERGRWYHKRMSSPNTAYDACSRLSVPLATGAVSMREAAQAAWARQREVRSWAREDKAGWAGAIDAFIGRLHWHCHFIQKLEDAPEHEWRNVHPGYDHLRREVEDPEVLAAWAKGETGLPFVDACMRALVATGWINFRMRAMLQAVASYHLWLPWRESGLHLARVFTDYEPGIHWNQAQMQSGTTGINTIRIYNPVKQGRDHDADGAFIRRWVPELAGVGDPRFLHEPWRMDRAAQDAAGCRLGADYPEPVVDPVVAARAAREAIWAVRRSPDFKAEADRIQDKHGSRKSGLPPSNPARRRGARKAPAPSPAPAPADAQARLDL
ncbi:MAG: deoxyribodipyrimidine photo-lyase/cryptochrome family protein [Azospirillaceae bacterium]